MSIRTFVAALILACAWPAGASGHDELVEAIKQGQLDRVRALVESGTSADSAETPAQSSPLVIAVVRRQHAIARFLLEKDASPDARHATYYNATALMLAVNNRDVEMARLLLDAGANPNLTDKSGDSALNWATFYGDAALADLLLAHHIDATLYGHGNALDVAMRRGHQALVERYTDYLGRRNPVSSADARMFDAVERGDVTALTSAIAAGGDVNASDGTHRCALGLAARRGDASMVRALLKAGARIDAADPIGFTPLMEGARDGKAEVVAVLLEHGADIARRAHANGLELTALHLAAASGQADTVRMLVQRGAPIDARDSELATPLLWATNQQPAIAVVLVELGANADLPSNEGITPRQIATERKMEALLAALAARS